AASTKVSPTPSSSSSIRLVPSPKPLTPSNSLARPATNPLFLTAPVKPKTPSSPTSPSPPPRARSRPAPPPAPTASPNTINSSASKRNSAPPPASTATLRSSSFFPISPGGGIPNPALPFFDASIAPRTFACRQPWPAILECGGLPPLSRRNPLRQRIFLRRMWRPLGVYPHLRGEARLSRPSLFDAFVGAAF